MANKKGKNKGYTYRTTKSGKKECRAYRDIPNGGRKQLSATGKTENEARQKLEKKYKELCKGSKKQLKVKEYTVESWFNYWLYTIMKPIFDSKKSDTTSWYRRVGKNFITVIGNKKLKSLKISDVQTVVNTMLKRNLQPKYIKEVVSLLSTCLNYAVSEKYMEELDFKKVKKPKLPKNKKITILGNEEDSVLKDYFLSSSFNMKYLPIKVMYDIGLRPEEVGGLNFEDIDYDTVTLSVSRACIFRDKFDSKGNKTGRVKVLKETKTENGVRDINIPTLIQDFKEQAKFIIAKGYSNSNNEPVFRNSRGGRYTQETLRALFNRLAEELQITQLGCYTLRHGFASKLIKVTDIETTRTTLGQENVKTTQGYLHTDTKQHQKAMNTLANSMYGSKEKSA